MAGIEGFKGQEQEKRQSDAKKPTWKYVGVDSSKFYPEEESADAQLQADLQGLDDSYDNDSTNVAEKEENIENLINPEVDKTIEENEPIIKNVAQEFGVDKNTIGAIIYNEQRLLSPGENTIDGLLGYVRKETSIGLGQVQLLTAEFVEEKGYIEKVASKTPLAALGTWITWMGKTERWERISRLKDPEWNIRYVGAYLKYIQDIRKWQFPAIKNRPDILATCYNRGRDKPEHVHSHPESNKYGKQVQSLYRHVQQLMW